MNAIHHVLRMNGDAGNLELTVVQEGRNAGIAIEARMRESNDPEKSEDCVCLNLDSVRELIEWLTQTVQAQEAMLAKKSAKKKIEVTL
jgi:hypothetical protein